MLQISNIDEGKSEWNINETHILIPMIDGDITNKEPDKILTSALTLNSLETGEQAILSSPLESSLVIGLDKNLFETPNYKSDLVIIQNSDLKLLSCNTDLKNPVAYTLSYVDQDKSEILWQSSKDRICANDKAVLEVRDVLNYDDLDKNERQINLASIDSDIVSQVSKCSGEILAEVTEDEEKKESPFINYYSASQSSEAVPILSHLDDSKFIQNVKSVETKEGFTDVQQTDSEGGNSLYRSRKNVQKNILQTGESFTEINNRVPIRVVEIIKNKTEKKEKTVTCKEPSNSKNEKDVEADGISNFLLEKSLPLKKKAKMKRTLMSGGSDHQRSLSKQDVTVPNQSNMYFPTERKVKTSNNHFQKTKPCNNDSDEPSINEVSKKRKTNFKISVEKSQKPIFDSLAQGEENESDKGSSLVENDNNKKIDSFGLDRKKFNNIQDLVEGLRKCRMINATVWKILNSGLKEMKVDILKEMNGKANEKRSPEQTQYSPQLKAFALVLYFKQPAAFNHLSRVYESGWPSLNVIKEWKRRMNSHQRPNFIRTERIIEENNRP